MGSQERITGWPSFRYLPKSKQEIENMSEINKSQTSIERDIELLDIIEQVHQSVVSVNKRLTALEDYVMRRDERREDFLRADTFRPTDED